MNAHLRGSFWSKFILVLLIVLTVAGAATAQYTRYIQQITKYVTLDDDGYRVEITTFDETVDDLLKRYDITLGPGDEIHPAPEETLSQETIIKITRAMSTFVVADGREQVVYLTRGNVSNVLEKAGVKVRVQDSVSYPLHQGIAPEMRIVVTRMDEQIIIETEALPYQVVAKTNSRLDEGVDKIVQDGKQGELERKILVVYKDGVEIARQVEESIVAEPVDHLVEKGTGKHFTNSRGLVVRYSNTKKMSATAYSAHYNSTGKNPGDKYYGVTSSGRKVKPHHTIAAPPNIPFGTKVYIPELVIFWRNRGVEISGIFTVEDRGGAIQGNKIDIYFESEAMCRLWGRRNVSVYFIR